MRIRSPISSPILGGIVSPIGRPPLETVAWSVDWSALSSGDPLPDGLTFSRASSEWQRADSSGGRMYASVTVATDEIAIGTLRVGGANVALLQFEGAYTNEIGGDTRGAYATSPWNAGVSPATLNAAAGVDGAAGVAASFACASGGYSNYRGAGGVASPFGRTLVVGAHYKPVGASVSYNVRWYAGGALFAAGGTLADGVWQAKARIATGDNTTFQLQICDGADRTASGGIAAGARGPHLVDWPFAIEVPSHLASASWLPLTWHSGTHAGPRLTRTDPTDSIFGGRLRLRITWSPQNGEQRWSGRLWSLSPLDYAEIDRVRGQIRTCVGGLVERTTSAVPLGTDLLDLRHDAGNGRVASRYRRSADGGATWGAWTSLGAGVLTMPPIVHEGEPLDLLCDGTASQLEGAHVATTCFRSGSSATPGITIYASPTGTGDGSIGDPASLPDALDLAATHLPAPPESVRIICRGGTYYFPALFPSVPDLDSATYNGLVIMPYPGETVVWSAGEAISGWADDGSGDGCYVAACDFETRDLWVDGVRATIARSVIDASGWTAKSTGSGDAYNGFLSDSHLLSDLADPTAAEIVAVWAWKYGILRVKGAVANGAGDDVEIEDEDHENAYSQPVSGLYPAPADICFVQGVREFIDNTSGTEGYWCQDPGTLALSYKPLSGQAVTGGGAVDVVAGKWEKLFTITGTSVLPAKIRIRGITFAHTTYLHPSSHGYATIQAGYSGYTGTPETQVPVRMLAAVTTQYTDEDTIFAGCTWSHIGGMGISCERGSRHLVNNHSYSDIAGGFALAGDVTTTARTAVEADWVDVTFEHGQGTSGGVIYAGCADYISGYSRITVRDCTGSGGRLFVAGGWGWLITNPSDPAMVCTTVQRCRFYGANRAVIGSHVIEDLGEVYFVGTQSGSVVEDCYVTIATGSYGAIYLDSGSGVTVRDNVCIGNVFVQCQAPKAIEASFANNYYSALNTNGTLDPSITVSGNTTGSTAIPTGAPWADIITEAGR